MTDSNKMTRVAGVRTGIVVKEAVRLAAFHNRRSINQEVSLRLEQSLKVDGWIDEAEKNLGEAA